ncbi:NAD(P)-dependent dehydrogenase (short-subunit alcohol dehydrogenase family) [Rhizobium aquaticum]|uniref:NAD(P)-dependent dehydrogenase (Short-subunit alcohol dehydrogenase family) n=1 Tax=Rhizobium aquaticum TaxID=1549636 RepID=A0ABV2J6J3_9HYPH
MTSGKTILITGSSTGIGAFCARALKEKGWRVFATVRREEDRVSLEDDGIETFLMDYADLDSIRRLVNDVTTRTGGTLDALFNNGAYGQTGAVEDLTVEVLKAQFDVNFFGWHELTRLIVPIMRRQGHGRIVQCSSILGVVPAPYRGAYTASKFALEGLSITLRMELAGTGIHVSLIEPGPIESRFLATALEKFLANIDYRNSVHAASYERQLGRLKGERRAKGKLGPEAVMTVLEKALTSPNPKAHYPVTTVAKQGMLLKKLLPADMFYKLISRVG